MDTAEATSKSVNFKGKKWIQATSQELMKTSPELFGFQVEDMIVN